MPPWVSLLHADRRGHEASPGRSQAAAGHRRWKGNHRDERKRSSQGGAKLWPEKAAAMAGPTQTCGAPSRHMVRAPGKGTYLQEHPPLLAAFEERSRCLLIPLSISLARAFCSGLSHFKAFLRAAPNAAAGVRFGKAVPWAGKPSAAACRPLRGRVWGNRRRWQGGFVPLAAFHISCCILGAPLGSFLLCSGGFARGCWCEKDSDLGTWFSGW